MKNILILEGIASSGKTTIENRLVERLIDATILSENDTLMPIIENKNPPVALAHLNAQLQSIINHPAHTVIIDRFHLTHAFRTHANLEMFSHIESELQRIGNVLLVLLIIDPDHIHERIEETILHRKENWKKGAQGSLDEKVAYYTQQQVILQSLITASHLPTIAINTTEKQWDAYVDEIRKNEHTDIDS